MVNAIWENLLVAGNILKAALGLGFVIFIHELGHFVMAKWNGVKVERFSIGFGPTLASFRRGVGFRIGTGSRPPGPGDPPSWGETEYVLAALPLGGYVSMLGENIEESTEEAVNAATKTADPRAFNNKSVWSRMQIITAGVIMNLLLGIVCYAYAYTQGVIEQSAKLGYILPGSPAYKAGLRPGDEVVAIDGRRDVAFKDLMVKVTLSSVGQKVKFTIKRPGETAEKVIEIEPVRELNRPSPTIGVRPSTSLELFAKGFFQTPPDAEVDRSQIKPDEWFLGEDKVIAIGPANGPLEPVTEYEDFLQKSDRLRGQPIVVEVERKTLPNAEPDKKVRRQITLPVHRSLDFGFQLTPGPIVAIRDDSPAQKAGLLANDRIIAVNGQTDFDPMKLPDLARDSANQPMKLTIERPRDGKPAEKLESSVTPDASTPWGQIIEPVLNVQSMDIPGLGLAMSIEPKIKAIAAGSPAAKAGLKVGQTLESITYAFKKSMDEKSDPKPITVNLDSKGSAWPTAFLEIQDRPCKSIELAVSGLAKPLTIVPVVDPDRFLPLRGLAFHAILKPMPPLGLVPSLQRGFDETVENVTRVLGIFRSLAQGRVGRDSLGGIIPIGKIAYDSASSGLVSFLQFLAFLSVNLAVINSLPIPVLDGGTFLFLVAEKIRGRPLPERALNYLRGSGLVFVVGLILFINGNDIYKLIRSYF